MFRGDKSSIAIKILHHSYHLLRLASLAMTNLIAKRPERKNRNFLTNKSLITTFSHF